MKFRARHQWVPSPFQKVTMTFASSFNYMGKNKLPVTGKAVGIAFDTANGVIYTMEKSGIPTCKIAKLTLPGTYGPDATLVSRSRDITAAEVGLNLPGLALIGIRSLWWDSVLQVIWMAGGSFYANGIKTNILTAFDPVTETMYGGWTVNSTVHSDKCKGNVIPTPASLLSAVGGRALCMFGAKGSTSQGQSWGAGLVAVEKPSLALAADSELSASVVIHWPYTHVIGTWDYSNYPRMAVSSDKYIYGNDNVNLTSVYSYENNTFYDITSSIFGPNDGMLSMCEIDGNLMYFGRLYHGMNWYGLPQSHRDPTDAGVTFDNNLDSDIFPGQKVNGYDNPRGRHGELPVVYWHKIPIANILTGIGASSALIEPTEYGKVSELGGTVNTGDTIVGQCHFDPNTNLLRLMIPNGAGTTDLHTWSYTGSGGGDPDPPPAPPHATRPIRLKRRSFQ